MSLTETTTTETTTWRSSSGFETGSAELAAELGPRPEGSDFDVTTGPPGEDLLMGDQVPAARRGRSSSRQAWTSAKQQMRQQTSPPPPTCEGRRRRGRLRLTAAAGADLVTALLANRALRLWVLMAERLTDEDGVLKIRRASPFELWFQY
jgi:hypothetical protein